MFVKRLVDKASMKKPAGNLDGLKSSDVEPRTVFHYGLPSGAHLIAYDTCQNILAISTRDGRIKLFGKDNTQALLESPEAVPSKFLQFIQNKGILLNVTSSNHIEVWDVDKQSFSHVHVFKDDVAAFTVSLQGEYIYVGDYLGNVFVLKLDHETLHITPMKYTIPFSASHGNISETSTATPLRCILPQPTAESKRVLLVYKDGLIVLWDIRESKLIFSTGGSTLQSENNETKKVSSASWACPFGSKVAVGYSNGEIFIFSIPATPNLRPELGRNNNPPTAPTCKLNLGYRSEKVPIASIKWFHDDGKASRIYVMGAPDVTSTNLLQVVLLNDQTETRMIKLGLHLSEPCIDMEVMPSSSDGSRHKQDLLVLTGKSGHVYVYDDRAIEKYLVQSQSRGSPSLPKELMLKIPHADSTITTAKLFSHNPSLLNLGDEDYMLLARNLPSFFPPDGKPKDGAAHFTGFRKIKNVYITGHSDGTINFWDVSCPILIPILSLKQQTEDDSTPSGIAVTALHFDLEHRLLISGDQSGMVRIYKFKPEPFSSETNFLSFPGSSRKGNNHCVQGVKHTKVTGPVLSLNISQSSGYLAIGSDQGFVSVIDPGGPTLLYQNHIASELSAGIISLQFGTCSLHGFEKKVLVVATKDSSVHALDGDTGNMLSPSAVHPKKPSRALLMQVLDVRDKSGTTSNVPDQDKGNPDEDVQKQSFLLMCNEKAAYVYSLNHAVQGIKKVYFKKKFQSSSCCWASTFCSGSDSGLILVFRTGKIEIRSLPDLTLLKESSIRGFAYSTPKADSSESAISCSQEGELIMVNGDQEIYFVSVLRQNGSYRNLDSLGQVYSSALTISEDGLGSAPVVQKEKKKGLFSTVIGGSRQKPASDPQTEDTRESIQELATIFATANFPEDDGTKETSAMDDNTDDLGIDDIDLDDPGQKSKDKNPLAALSKQKLASKFQAFKGKMKQMKAKNEKNIEEAEQDEKAGAIDQIKKKYGFSQSNETSAAKVAQSKLQENARKLQGINVKSTIMQDTAKSFSSMAKEMLRAVEKDRHSS